MAPHTTAEPVIIRDVVSFRLLGDPFAKQRPKFRRSTGTAYTPDKTVSYEDSLKNAWHEQSGVRLPGAPIVLRVVANYVRSASHLLRSGELSAAGRRAIPGARQDADNVLKIVGDALNKFAWPDDRYIVDAWVVKRWADVPSLEVTAFVALDVEMVDGADRPIDGQVAA